MGNTELWLNILRRLQPTIMKAHFLTWFQGTAILDLADGVLKIGVPTVYSQNWVASKYNLKVLQAAQELNPEITAVEYEVKGDLENGGEGVDVQNIFRDQVEKKVRKVRNVAEVTVRKAGSDQAVTSQMMNSRYRLNNFVVGHDNRLPHAACNAVVNMPGGIYNPLYIYGKVGMGKTHLLQAVGNEIVNRYPDMVVKYITAEKFVTEVVEAIGKRHMEQFKKQYRNVDCFLIDDVQFFARKDSSQQEFFHTFNTLYEANKQIVLTSDRPPSELDDLDERLKSRFAMGMVLNLLPPDFETRLAILQAKTSEFGMLIDPDILSFIATNVTTSVRALEGVLKQLMAEMQLFERTATLRCVAEIIQRMDKAQKIIGYDFEEEGQRKAVRSVKGAIEAVAEYFGVTVDDLVGESRKQAVARPRQICMYLIKQELQESYERIGDGFGGRNHTTVMHACSKTAALLKKDLRLVRDLNALKREMGL